jgi:hypothetical protein
MKERGESLLVRVRSTDAEGLAVARSSRRHHVVPILTDPQSSPIKHHRIIDDDGQRATISYFQREDTRKLLLSIRAV